MPRMRGISLIPRSSTQAENGLVLTLRIGVKRVRPNLRLVLHKRVQDMDRLPNTAGNEAGEQGDIAVGDVVVGDAAIAAVSNMLRAHEIVFAELHVRSVGDGRLAAAPMPGQWKANILIDRRQPLPLPVCWR